jgi:hypothetical protein
MTVMCYFTMAEHCEVVLRELLSQRAALQQLIEALEQCQRMKLLEPSEPVAS